MITLPNLLEQHATKESRRIADRTTTTCFAADAGTSFPTSVKLSVGRLVQGEVQGGETGRSNLGDGEAGNDHDGG